jgi:spore maturation protein CgeB
MVYKIIIIGANDKYNLEWFYQYNFIKYYNFQVIPILYNLYGYFYPNYNLFSRLYLARYNRKVSKIVEKTKPDITLIFKGVYLTEQTMTHIRKFCNLVIHYMTDEAEGNNFERSKKVSLLSDYVFTSMEKFIPLYKKLGINAKYLGYACEPDMHRKLPFNINDYRYFSCDICFIGTYRKEREYLLSKLKNYNLKIFGPGWFLRCKNKQLRRKIMNRSVKGHELAKAYNYSKIAINIFKKIDVLFGTKANMRVYEALGCGSFLLTDYANEIEDLFQIGKEIIIYNNDDLLEKIDYYLSNKKEREEIAIKGQEKVYKNYTYWHRINEILKTIKW